MSLIAGTKRWTLTIVGELPPGVSEQECVAMLLTAVTVPLQMIPSMRETQVTFSDSTPSQPGKLKLS